MNRRSRSSWRPGLRELLLALFFLSCLGPVIDYDLWLHMAAGREMWETGRIVHLDSFSHTVPGAEWIYHEWLAALLSFAIYSVAGVNGMVLLKAVMMTASMAVLLGLFHLRGHGRGPAPVVALLAAMVASRNVALERPHLFTILFLMLFVYWLERQRRFGRALPWTMVPICALWANIHGGFILGLLAFGPFLVEDVWIWLRERYKEGPEWVDEADKIRNLEGRIRRSLTMLAACAFATLFNPYGLQTLLYPLQYANPSPFMKQIEEWASPNFQKQIVLEAVLLALVGALLLSRRSVALRDGIFVMAAAHLILTAVRNSFLVGPFIAPASLDHLADFFTRPGLPGRLGRKIGHLDRGRFGSLLLVTVLAGSIWVLNSPERISSERFPTEAVAWLNENRPPGRLFNDYDFGGYLMFNLPAYPVFVDGRVDVYSKHRAFSDFLEVWRLGARWEEVLDRYGVGVVLVEQRQSLVALLGVHEGWEKVFEGEVAVVFLRRSGYGPAQE